VEKTHSLYLFLVGEAPSSLSWSGSDTFLHAKISLRLRRFLCFITGRPAVTSVNFENVCAVEIQELQTFFRVHL